jgi:hypothetical protein
MLHQSFVIFIKKKAMASPPSLSVMSKVVNVVLSMVCEWWSEGHPAPTLPFIGTSSLKWTCSNDRSGQSRVVGYLARPVRDPFLVLGRVDPCLSV